MNAPESPTVFKQENVALATTMIVLARALQKRDPGLRSELEQSLTEWRDRLRSYGQQHGSHIVDTTLESILAPDGLPPSLVDVLKLPDRE